jgi:hypothetical protein
MNEPSSVLDESLLTKISFIWFPEFILKEITISYHKSQFVFLYIRDETVGEAEISMRFACMYHPCCGFRLVNLIPWQVAAKWILSRLSITPVSGRGKLERLMKVTFSTKLDLCFLSYSMWAWSQPFLSLGTIEQCSRSRIQGPSRISSSRRPNYPVGQDWRATGFRKPTHYLRKVWHDELHPAVVREKTPPARRYRTGWLV